MVLKSKFDCRDAVREFNLHSLLVHFPGKRIVEPAWLCLRLLHRDGCHVQHQLHLQPRCDLDRQVSLYFPTSAESEPVLFCLPFYFWENRVPPMLKNTPFIVGELELP